MYDDLQEFLEEHDGIVTVTELAVLTGEDEGYVRRWARENDVRRCGSTFVFGAEKAAEFVEDLESDDADGRDDGADARDDDDADEDGADEDE